jgi:hypothetical protein
MVAMALVLLLGLPPLVRAAEPGWVFANKTPEQVYFRHATDEARPGGEREITFIWGTYRPEHEAPGSSIRRALGAARVRIDCDWLTMAVDEGAELLDGGAPPISGGWQGPQEDEHPYPWTLGRLKEPRTLLDQFCGVEPPIGARFASMEQAIAWADQELAPKGLAKGAEGPQLLPEPLQPRPPRGGSQGRPADYFPPTPGRAWRLVGRHASGSRSLYVDTAGVKRKGEQASVVAFEVIADKKPYESQAVLLWIDLSCETDTYTISRTGGWSEMVTTYMSDETRRGPFPIRPGGVMANARAQACNGVPATGPEFPGLAEAYEDAVSVDSGSMGRQPRLQR